jgi:carbonic anhydrase
MEAIPIPNQIIHDLVAGNQRFLEGKSSLSPDSSLRKLKEFAKSGQTPKAVVLCCSDSRAPVEMIFDQDIGDLFVIRVAGNIIAPSLVGSIEFAINTFGTNLVVVMGHTQCGAVTATLNHIEKSGAITSENIQDIVSRIKPHILFLAQMREMPREEKMALAVEANVRASVSQLWHSSTMIERLVQQGQLEIHGAVLNLSTGQVAFLQT